MLNTASNVPFSHPLYLESLRGQPVVFALVRRWTVRPELSEPVDEMRRHLRRLGAVMVIYAANGAWCLRPEAGVEQILHPQSLITEIGRRHRYPVSDDATIYLFDEDGVVRFHHIDADLSAARILSSGLEAASWKSANDHWRGPADARRAWSTTSLMTGLTLAALEDAKRMDEEQSERYDRRPAIVCEA